MRRIEKSALDLSFGYDKAIVRFIHPATAAEWRRLGPAATKVTILDPMRLADPVSNRSVWDGALADSVLGKVLLVGLSYLSDDGGVLEQEQFYGTVSSAHPGAGIVLLLAGQ